MNKKEIIEFCLTLSNTFEEKPFKDEHETIVMKHKDNKKWYALIMEVLIEQSYELTRKNSRK